MFPRLCDPCTLTKQVSVNSLKHPNIGQLNTLPNGILFNVCSLIKTQLRGEARQGHRACCLLNEKPVDLCLRIILLPETWGQPRPCVGASGAGVVQTKAPRGDQPSPNEALLLRVPWPWAQCSEVMRSHFREPMSNKALQ